jgi:hypothetical protein
MQLAANEQEHFIKVLHHGIEMANVMDSTHNKYMELRSHCDIICNYVESVQAKQSVKIQMTPRQIQDFLNVIDSGMELIDQLEFSFNEFLKVEKENEIIYNYVTDMVSKYCIHFNYPYHAGICNFLKTFNKS